MRRIIFLVLGILFFGSYALAQSTLTIDQVEAQVVAIQAQLVTAVSGQPATLFDLVNTNTQWVEKFQVCWHGLSGEIQSIQTQIGTINLQLSTVGTLTQLSLDNQTNVQTLQAQIVTLQTQVTALQAQVAALSPTPASSHSP
jgi:predicted  nucleic acid-binding Zn-ribbon protein